MCKPVLYPLLPFRNGRSLHIGYYQLTFWISWRLQLTEYPPHLLIWQIVVEILLYPTQNTFRAFRSLTSFPGSWGFYRLTCLPYMRISCTVVNVSVAPKHPPNIPAKNSMMMNIWLRGIAMMHIALSPSAIVTSILGLKLNTISG